MTKIRHVLMNIIYLFLVPVRNIKDRGPTFTCEIFETFCSFYEIRHILNTLAAPRANGLSEWVSRTVLNCLAATAGGQPDLLWDNYVTHIQSAINCSSHKTKYLV